MATFNPAGGQTYNLNSSISSTATSITLSSFAEPVSGVLYTMVLLNTSIMYGTIQPKTSSSEFISFTGITQNADGTATLTGVTRGLAKKYPYTASATFQLPHSGQSPFILSDAPQVFSKYTNKDNDEHVTGLWTFDQTPIGLNPGAVQDASTTVKGIGKVSVAPISPTIPIFVGDNDTRVSPVSLATVTAGEVIALGGSSGTPGTGNEYITKNDVSTAGASSKIVRLSGTAYPAGDGSALTNIKVPSYMRLVSLGANRLSIASTSGGISSSSPIFAMNSPDASTVTCYFYNLDALTSFPYLGGSIAGGNGGVLVTGTGRTAYGAMIGQYLYVIAYDGSANRIHRIDSQAIATAATITVSGTAVSVANIDHPIFTDGTFLYISDGSTATNLLKYSISGTTITYVATISFTSFVATAAAWCDGTNVYQTDGTTLRKWALAGGATSATRTTVQGAANGILGISGNSTLVFSSLADAAGNLGLIPTTKL